MSVFCHDCRRHWMNHCRECSYDLIDRHRRDTDCTWIDYINDEIHSRVDQKTGELQKLFGFPEWMFSSDDD